MGNSGSSADAGDAGVTVGEAGSVGAAVLVAEAGSVDWGVLKDGWTRPVQADPMRPVSRISGSVAAR